MSSITYAGNPSSWCRCLPVLSFRASLILKKGWGSACVGGEGVVVDTAARLVPSRFGREEALPPKTAKADTLPRCSKPGALLRSAACRIAVESIVWRYVLVCLGWGRTRSTAAHGVQPRVERVQPIECAAAEIWPPAWHDGAETTQEKGWRLR